MFDMSDPMPLIFSTFIFMSAVTGVSGLVSTILATRKSRLSARLVERGQRTTGQVVAVDTYSSVDDSNRVRDHLIETIKFTTLRGEECLATPAHSDIGMANRQGHSVTVYYDPDQPEIFIAPVNGREMSRKSTDQAVLGGAIAAISGFGTTAALLVAKGYFGW